MAQKTKAELTADVESLYQNNLSGNTTNSDINGQQKNVIDSYLNTEDTGQQIVKGPVTFQQGISGLSKNSIEEDNNKYQLVGDDETPGIDKYYGTNDQGDKGFYDLPKSERYTKITVFDETVLNNFNSGGVAPDWAYVDVPGLQITIDRDGDYTFYIAVNCNNDQNEEIDLTIALTPINERTIETPSGPVVVPAGTQFTSDFQVVRDRQQKGQDQTLSGLFLFDALEVDDLIDFKINTRGDNVDLSNRRAYGYTINDND